MSGNGYDAAFYSAHDNAGHRAAYRALGRGISRFFRPRSVIDLGCGTGGLLAEIGRRSGAECLGVDAPACREAILAARPRLSAANFVWRDLTVPFRLPGFGRFDLAVSMEVAEHLPANAMEAYFGNVTQFSDLLLFSAAHPGQGGTGHVNERNSWEWDGTLRRFGFERDHTATVDLWRNVGWLGIASMRRSLWYLYLGVYRGTRPGGPP